MPDWRILVTARQIDGKRLPGKDRSAMIAKKRKGATQMKLAFFNDFRLGVVLGDKITDVTSSVQDIPHLGPHDLITAFDLLDVLGAPPAGHRSVGDLLARFGVFDVSSTTRRVLTGEPDRSRQFALAAMAPEFAVT